MKADVDEIRECSMQAPTVIKTKGRRKNTSFVALGRSFNFV